MKKQYNVFKRSETEQSRGIKIINLTKKKISKHQ